MRTVLLGERPPEVEELIARRRRLGQDLFDEVWDGDYHMAPAPSGGHGMVDHEIAGILRPLAKQAGLRGSGPANVGTPNNYRVPDQSYYTDRSSHVFHSTAEIVIEIVSPNDESRLKSTSTSRSASRRSPSSTPTPGPSNGTTGVTPASDRSRAATCWASRLPTSPSRSTGHSEPEVRRSTATRE